MRNVLNMRGKTTDSSCLQEVRARYAGGCCCGISSGRRSKAPTLVGAFGQTPTVHFERIPTRMVSFPQNTPTKTKNLLGQVANNSFFFFQSPLSSYLYRCSRRGSASTNHKDRFLRSTASIRTMQSRGYDLTALVLRWSRPAVPLLRNQPRRPTVLGKSSRLKHYVNCIIV